MATQVETAIKKARSMKGSHAYDNYCQRFVRICYEAAGIYGNAGSAREACRKWKVSNSKSDIPVGAAVYFSNSNDGHVGIYVGNGKMIHAWGSKGVIESKISICRNYEGWGWQGGKKPSGAGVIRSSNSNSGSEASQKSVELCSTSIVSVLNTGDKVKVREYCRNINNTDGKYELHIIGNGIDYMPMVLDSVEWSTEWIDTAGKLTFTILKDSNINIAEGNVVIFKENGNGVFYGYLFEKSKGKDGKINCTAYDQLRYFKNKDTYCYKNMKYSDVLKMIANDYGLNCSEDMADTGYAIPARIEDNESLFDILKNARELTMKAVNQIYIMYDDFGLLTIKELNDLKTDYWLTERTAEDFDYKTSIDSDVYNRIQLYKDDSTTGNREKYIYEDGSTINSWGILQKTVKLEEGENPDVNGPLVLNKYNHKSKTFTVKGCFGDIRLRGGASIFVSIDVGDTVYDKALFFITKASHSFGKEYTCDLTLVGMSEMNFVGDSDL